MHSLFQSNYGSVDVLVSKHMGWAFGRRGSVAGKASHCRLKESAKVCESSGLKVQDPESSWKWSHLNLFELFGKIGV